MTVPGSANPLLLRSAAPTAYQVSRSLRFNGSIDSAHLSRTPASAGTSRTAWTLSFWVKRSTFSTAQWLFFSSDLTANTTAAYFTASDTLEFYEFQSGSYVARLITTQVFRDPSAWYHFVFTWDTNNGTSGDRLRIYVNNQKIDAFSTSTYPSSGTQSRWNNNVLHYLSRGVGSEYFAGYLANVEFVDGSALTPSSFAETDATTGQWIPKLYSGSYGTNGFKLTFADNSNNTASTLGADTSSNGNNWTPNNLSVTAGVGNDALTDSPTSYGSGTSGGDVRGNFATLNPLDKASAFTLENGNLQGKSTSSFKSARATIGMPTGKWYWEHTIETISDMTGVQPAGAYLDSHIGTSGVGDSGVAYGYTTIYNQGSSSSAGGATSNGAVVSVAFDADSGKLWFRVNGGAWLSGDPAAGTSPSVSGLTGKTYFPAVTGYNNSAGMYLNFGQRAFAYTPPTNFNPLVDTYLPTPTVAKPSTVMDVKLFSGNGSTQNITGFAFSPDFAWFKRRSSAFSHELFDVIRGGSNVLFSDLTSAEANNAALVTSFNSDGVSVGSALGANGSGVTSVMWAWDAGTTTTSNGSGSITSSVRANASAGFSIVTYTGTGASATIGHGGLANLSNGMIIIKNRSSATNWRVYHSALGNTKVIFLSTTGTSDTNSVYWNNTSPTSTVFSVGSDDGVNGNGNAMVAYCFAPVTGYSSAFSWSGTGSTDGPAIYLGFRPKLIIWKRTNAAANWAILDSSRSSYNVADDWLGPNSSSAEAADNVAYAMDFLSNGLKIRATHEATNEAGGTYVGFAFAESPFQYARAR